MASTETEADATDSVQAEDDHDPGSWPVTSIYLVVSLGVGAWAAWRWLNGGALIISYTTTDDLRAALMGGQLTLLLQVLLVLASQLVFLVPALDRRLHRPAVTTVAALAGILAILELLVSGFLLIAVGGIMWSPGSDGPIMRPIAASVAWASPPLVLAAGAVALRLGLAQPPRKGACGAVVIAVLVSTSFTMALIAAPF